MFSTNSLAIHEEKIIYREYYKFYITSGHVMSYLLCKQQWNTKLIHFSTFFFISAAKGAIKHSAITTTIFWTVIFPAVGTVTFLRGVYLINGKSLSYKRQYTLLNLLLCLPKQQSFISLCKRIESSDLLLTCLPNRWSQNSNSWSIGLCWCARKPPVRST